ncbi:MAG: selenocysteine-specific translation elongation factor [Dehalococcoidia bacterium]|nr:MAG: selenocysteine-specific translation elongation factor [Dehalococcoidia bacterium]
MFVLGTAGHIDHGKSVLVHALTGIDPDRLREEKERGMTIDLGFAWFKLPSGQEVGVVDVPGHERFVRNMLAGVGGIDLALLVVAANEGVMPQTREHLAIIDLLEIKRGVVAITKKDTVDDELLSLVRMEVEELIAPTTLAQAPIIPVSAVTGEGLPDLVAAIDNLLSTAEPRKDLGKPRLAIDRVFTIVGAGTVVTGTLIDGSLAVGQEVEIIPAALKSRLRGLQTHKSAIKVATPGSRVAANLVGVTTAQLQRGDVLTKPGWLLPTMMLTARLHLLPYLRRLRHSTTVSLHTGATEVMAKVRLLEKEEIQPGEVTWAQFLLNKPVAVVSGDRFIIRSPEDTLGGGEIVGVHDKRLRRFRPHIIQNLKVRKEGTAEEIIAALVETRQPLALDGLLAQCNLPASSAQKAVETLIQQGQLVSLGEHRLLLTKLGWEKLSGKALAIVEDYHRRFPTRPGMPKVELASRLKLGGYSAAARQRLGEEGILVEEGAIIRSPSHQIQLTPAQQAKIDVFLKSIAKDPYSPPTDLKIEPDLLTLLIERQQVVRVSSNIVFLAPTYNDMVSKVVAHIKARGRVTLAEVRDLFHTSRKYAQAFLEHLDEKKITRRVGDERVLWRERMGVEPTEDTTNAPRRI